MSDTGRHPEDALQQALDGRLDDDALAALEAHLSSCAVCRETLQNWRRLKSRLAAVPPSPPPKTLAAALKEGFDRADRRAAFRRRGAAIAAVAAVLALFAWLAPRPGPSPSRVAEDYHALRSGRLTLALETADVARLERFFTEQGIGFETRVFDLAMMQYQLVGGRRHSREGRPSALFAYRGPGGHLLLCEMYPGSVSELPPAGDVREDHGIRFHIFRQGEVTLVFWQEGEVVCALAGDGDPDTVVRLAYSKAVRV